MSAARAQPLPKSRPNLTRAELATGAQDTALNVASVLRDTWEDFQNSDRHFKYKAGILAAWLLMSVTTFFVACPGTGSPHGIGALLVVAGDADSPIYMVKNDGQEVWTNVTVLVNGRYTTVVGQIPPNRDVTLSPKLMKSNDNQTAPQNLKVTTLEVKTDQGNTLLLENGKPP